MTHNVDYQIQLISFPSGKVHEAVTPNEDGSYTIFIDCSLSKEEQQAKFLHAMEHILGDDFSTEDIQKLEYEAHKYELSDELCAQA